MPDFANFLGAVQAHWPMWVVTIVLVVAAAIDGWKLKVPNSITYPMIVAGWVYHTAFFGFGVDGLAASLIGTVVGLALLLPAYAIGGMGAGDVKLLAGVGAWVGSSHTFYAFCVSTIVGAVIAVLMVVVRGAWTKHRNQFFTIVSEILTVKNPEKLAAIAAERKPSMMLLPYGIPIAIGSIAYFAWAGLLL